MIKIFDFEQNSLEWHEAKWGKIGGTLSKGLLIDSDTLLIDILGQHLEEFEPTDSFENDAMLQGKEREPFAIDFVEQYYGIKFERPALLISAENDLLCLSPDGLTADDEIAIEAKCLERKAHTAMLFNDAIPKDKMAQLVHYFTVNPKLKRLIFIAFRPESAKHFMRELTLDTEVDLNYKKTIFIEQFGAKGQPITPKSKQVPDIKTIREWVAISKANGQNLRLELQQSIEFIKNDF